jgi:hypothetical protein
VGTKVLRVENLSQNKIELTKDENHNKGRPSSLLKKEALSLRQRQNRKKEQGKKRGKAQRRNRQVKKKTGKCETG